MPVRRILCGVLGAALAGTTLSAQAPASEIDAHISAARAAAGLDYRATFVNLCLPAAPRGGGPGGAGPRAGGPPATPDRASWYASPYKVFDKDQRVTHAAIIENKRLGEVLAFIKSQQDVHSSVHVMTNSERIGYQKTGRKPPGARSNWASPR